MRLRNKQNEEKSVVMDLSALVQGSHQSGSLNDDLAQLTPAGENVFKKAFGDKTCFKSPLGSISVTFLFDPDMPFDSNAVLASITTDYMAEMKYQLTKFLIGEKEMAPRTPSLEEVIWTSIKKNLPPQAFSKNLLSDKKEFNAYLNIIKTQVEASYKEESKLTQAMTSRSWKFVFRIAIDAYPQKLTHKSEYKLQPGQKKNGVLVFILESKLLENKIIDEENNNHIPSIEKQTLDTDDKNNNKRKRNDQEDEERRKKKKIKK